MEKLKSNFSNLTIDFNQLVNLFTKDTYETFVKDKHLSNYVLEGIFVIKDVHRSKIFFNLLEKCVKVFNLTDKKLDAFLFIGFSPGACTEVHKDNYDVLLYNLYGKTLYTVENETYILNPTDLLYIEKNKVHQGFSITPRITFSLGVRGDIT